LQYSNPRKIEKVTGICNISAYFSRILLSIFFMELISLWASLQCCRGGWARDPPDQRPEKEMDVKRMSSGLSPTWYVPERSLVPKRMIQPSSWKL
jgi:hypothetical protein